MTITRIKALPFILLFFAGCSVSGGNTLQPPYQPLSTWESQLFAQARKDIFPDDVRSNLSFYKDALVAWAGIIVNKQIVPEAKGRVAVFTVEHHYFNWNEDINAERARFLLSPRGEGEFVVAWGEQGKDGSFFLDVFEPGDMIIAYGYPSQIRGKQIGLYPLRDIRPVKPAWYRTDVLDYGRPGEPVERLPAP